MSDGFTKFKKGIQLDPQTADPSNPAEGDLHYADGTARAKGLWQYKDGAWAEFGSGGAGGINYLEGDSSNAENGVGDWLAYADAAGTEPVDGTGGSPTVTLTQNTSSPLRDTADLLLTKDAANRQGEGAGCAFTIDSADQAKKLTISFDYTTSANYADDDVKVFVYDVTNTNLIRINGEDLKATSGNGTHYAQFQTAPDSTSYRLILHCSSTNASAYTVNFDNVKVGPTNLAFGATVTDWEDFTPTGTWTGNTTYSGKYKRIGDTALIDIEVETTGAPTPSATNLTITLPSFLTVDTTKVAVGDITSSSAYGFGNLLDSGTATHPVQPLMITSTQVQPRYANDPGTGLVRNLPLTDTAPITFANGDKISFRLTLPIAGWSSNAQMSEDLGGREIAFYGSLSGNQTISSTAETTVAIDTINFDSSGSFDTANNKFIVPESGKYIFTIKAYDSGYTDSYLRLRIKEGGTTELYRVDTETTGSVVGISQTTPPLSLIKGQEITFTVQSVADASYTLITGTGSTFFTGYKLASPQTMLETETVAARYTSNSGLTMTNNVLTQVAYEDLDYDTHNCVSSGIFTSPYSAYYNYTYTARLDSLSTDTGRIVQDVEKNGSSIQRKYIQIVNSTLQSVEISGNVYLNKGDTLEYNINQNNGANRNLATDGTYNTMQIHRIK